jgi:threonine synthase
MKYISTRGQAKPLSFDEVILKGLADDGGLYVPEQYPTMPKEQISALKGKHYTQIAEEVLNLFIDESSVLKPKISQIVQDSFKKFRNKDITELRDISVMRNNLFFLELYHGPTISFKDYAMQLVGNIFDEILKHNNKHLTIVGATSGDTGSAAIEAFRGKESVDIFILQPKGGVSEIQKKQMTTVDDKNVHNLVIDGSFDDCQGMLKRLFMDEKLNKTLNLSTVNSINWARIIGQTIYYFFTAAKLMEQGIDEFSVTVPCGNFGNIFAGWVAQKMGLNIKHLLIATNENDILYRFINTGEMRPLEVYKTIAPSIDIQVSSNAERMLFEYYGRNTEKMRDLMFDLNTKEINSCKIDRSVLHNIKKTFYAGKTIEVHALETIYNCHEMTGELIDPHSAVALNAALRHENKQTPMVVLGTAHPSKFPEAVKHACGKHPHLPAFLDGLMRKPEHFTSLPNDIDEILKHIYETMS